MILNREDFKLNMKSLDTKNLKKLKVVFQFKNNQTLSQAIILSAFSINKRKQYLKISEYRDNSFSKLWKEQFPSIRRKNWLAHYRSEFNQGRNRLAHRVFESPGGRGREYRLRDNSALSNDDRKLIKELRKDFNYLQAIIASDDEEAYQSVTKKAIHQNIKPGPVDKPKSYKGGNKRYLRNQKFKINALIKAKYKCEYQSTHKTFKVPKTGNQYMEAHHLIHMEYQKDYEYSLDVPENIVSLCPNCHKKIHMSNNIEKGKMIKKLLKKNRINGLKKRGININISKLLPIYKTTLLKNIQ